MPTLIELREQTATRYPRLTRSVQEAALAAQSDWADSSHFDVAPGGGLALTLGVGVQQRTRAIPARLEHNRDRDAEVGRIVAQVKAELVPGA